MVEDTESPRLYHIWAALGGMSAALGRRCYLPFGEDKLFSNQYILLVGNPGTRKSTALSKVKARLKANTGVRIAPTDSSGQRQGLIKAMTPSEEDLDKEKITSAVDRASDDGTLNGVGLQGIANIGATDEDEEDIEVDSLDKHTLMALASEFSGLIGQNNTQMLDFLTQMWDGDDDYVYQIKNEKLRLKNPLLNLIACTTPVSINNALPPSAGGQGVLSRFILVYGAKKYKLVPRPPQPPPEMVAKVSERYRVAYQLKGKFVETREAREYVDSLYGKPSRITDSRFAYYHERRHTHLLKIGMALAGSRGSLEITKADYREGLRILQATEAGMPDALGEFGMSPLALVKQHILEFCRGAGQPVPMSLIKAACHRDAKGRDIVESVDELKAAGQLILTQPSKGEILVSAKLAKEDTDNEIQSLLAQL